MRQTNSPKRTLLVASIVSASLALSGCAGFVDAGIKKAGKVTGSVIGKAVAERTPAPTAKTETDPRGGKFCDITTALGWPPSITDDRLNRPLRDAVGNLLDHGFKHCPEWKKGVPTS